MRDSQHPSAGLVNGFSNDFGVSREVRFLQADEFKTRTGMREDIIRLAWLIVLMRTREGSQVSYEWAHRDLLDTQWPEREVDGSHIIKELDENVETVSNRIWQCSTPLIPSKVPPKQDSMILSTGTMFQKEEEPEVRI